LSRRTAISLTAPIVPALLTRTSIAATAARDGERWGAEEVTWLAATLPQAG
jgi:hypothetical protein